VAAGVATICLAASEGMIDRKPQKTDPEDSPAANLADVKRIFVAPLVGGKGADEVRELIISSLSAAKQFIITENEGKADAVLKGAGDDKAFTDTFDSQEGITARGNGGVAAGGGTNSVGRKSIYSGIGAGQNESTHIKERKHEAYAAVRLVNRDGDVIWSTTQESNGAKFRGAGAEVAAKVAKQLAQDLERSRHPTPGMPETPALPAPPPSVTVKP